MHLTLDEPRSIEVSQRIQSKSGTPFENAYRAALATEGAVYVQGFITFDRPSEPIEHAWIELGETIVDPSLPYLKRSAQIIYYFPAQRLSVRSLKAAVEEAQEDYPEDDPLPIYGSPPYEYYGDIMLGGKDYLDAYQAAATASRDLN